MAKSPTTTLTSIGSITAYTLLRTLQEWQNQTEPSPDAAERAIFCAHLLERIAGAALAIALPREEADDLLGLVHSYLKLGAEDTSRQNELRAAVLSRFSHTGSHFYGFTHPCQTMAWHAVISLFAPGRNLSTRAAECITHYVAMARLQPDVMQNPQRLGDALHNHHLKLQAFITAAKDEVHRTRHQAA